MCNTGDKDNSTKLVKKQKTRLLDYFVCMDMVWSKCLLQEYTRSRQQQFDRTQRCALDRNQVATMERSQGFPYSSCVSSYPGSLSHWISNDSEPSFIECEKHNVEYLQSVTPEAAEGHSWCGSRCWTVSRLVLGELTPPWKAICLN